MTTLTLNTTTYQDNLIAEYLKEHNTKLDENRHEEGRDGLNGRGHPCQPL